MWQPATRRACVQTASVLRDTHLMQLLLQNGGKKFMSDFLNFVEMGKVTVIYIYQHVYTYSMEQSPS